ncbi:MIP family channel protein [Nocardioides sp.]|uniref:MIP family channel protein n=1 Tax=Nocardioides sp. TaxID=35761 RepID=UPI002ED649E8
MDDSSTLQKVAAEVIGTFVLVLFGCGSVVYWSETAGEPAFVSTTTTVGLAFGLALMVMIYAFGRISGAHFNPAVSVGAALGRRLPWNQVPTYIAAQLAGAILGAAVLFGLLHGFDGFSAEGNMGQNGFGDASVGGYAMWAALLLELVLTMIFVWVILAVTDERNEHPGLAPLAIGFALVAIHFVAIPATGTSVNPARSIGPALFAGSEAIGQVWVFVVAPLLGGAIAGYTYDLLFGETRPRAAAGAFAPPGAVPGYGAPDQYQQQWNEPAAAAPHQQHQWGQPQWTPEQIAAWQAQQAQAQPGQQQGWPDDEGDAERTQIRPPR